MTDFNLTGEGRVALITGGASGIGRAVAEVFAEAKYHLLLGDIDAEGGESTAEDLRSRGVAVEFVRTDVASEAQVKNLVQTAQERWQRLDFVLNNAGIVGQCATIEELDAEDLEQVLSVNLRGPFHVCKYAVGLMRSSGGGSILNISSITGENGSAYYAPYAAAKAGLFALTRGIARNVGRFNIRVNCLKLGSVAGTGLMRKFYEQHPEQRQQATLGLMQKIPLGRRGAPRDVAHMALFLASPLSRHLHGAVIRLDGGEMLGYH